MLKRQTHEGGETNTSVLSVCSSVRSCQERIEWNMECCLNVMLYVQYPAMRYY